MPPPLPRSLYPQGAGCGLNGRSLLKCYNLATVKQQRILQVIGYLSDALKKQMNDCLSEALGIP